MSRRRPALAAAGLAALAGLAAAAVAFAAAPKAVPCKGQKQCITVNGPWVAVPARGEATFLLECPKRQGTVGGVDVLASSADVRVSWEGGVPSAPIRGGGTTTGPYLLFHAVSAGGEPGLMQPWIGCLPNPPANPRSTTSARVVAVTKPGKALDLWQTLLALHPGHQTASRACGKAGERLLSGWQATAFKVDEAPSPALAARVHAALALGDVRVAVSVQTASGIPAGASPEVQVGAVCAR